MSFNYCKTALTLGLFCLPLLPLNVQAEVTPEQLNLLTIASKKDGGRDFNILLDLLIAAHPDDEAEIRKVAAQIRSTTPPVEKALSSASTPAPGEGTIFSDQSAQRLSQFFLPGWDKEIEVNALYSTGNTLHKSFGSATKFSREAGKHRQTVTTYFDFNSSDAVTNKRRYGIAFKNDYSINEVSYVSGFAGFEGDSFGAFNKRFTLNGAYGFRVFNNDAFKWNVEAGPALLMTKPLSTSDYESNFTAYASSQFLWVINDRSELENETKIYVGSEAVIENKTDYKLKVSGALSGKISFDILYNRDAPIDRKKTDTITRVGLLYDF